MAFLDMREKGVDERLSLIGGVARGLLDFSRRPHRVEGLAFKEFMCAREGR